MELAQCMSLLVLQTYKSFQLVVDSLMLLLKFFHGSFVFFSCFKGCHHCLVTNMSLVTNHFLQKQQKLLSAPAKISQVMIGTLERATAVNNPTNDNANSNLIFNVSVVAIEIIPLLALFPFEFGKLMTFMRSGDKSDKTLIRRLCVLRIGPPNKSISMMVRKQSKKRNIHQINLPHGCQGQR